MGVGIGMHLFTTATFTWLFVISLILFTRLTEFTKKEVAWGACVAIGWGKFGGSISGPFHINLPLGP